MSSTDLTDPAPVDLDRMNRVSPGYLPSRLVSDLPWTVVPLLVGVVLALVLHPLFWIMAGVSAALLLWLLWLLPAQVRHRRWLETPDELLITRGRLWRTFTVVPYGRIQFVDVTAGPVERAFGVARVKLHTASSTSDSEVVGLTATEADALRDRLAVAARERMSGL